MGRAWEGAIPFERRSRTNGPPDALPYFPCYEARVAISNQCDYSCDNAFGALETALRRWGRFACFRVQEGGTPPLPGSRPLRAIFRRGLESTPRVRRERAGKGAARRADEGGGDDQAMVTAPSITTPFLSSSND